MRLIDADALRESWVCQPGHDFEPSAFVYSIDLQPTIPAPRWVRCEEPPKYSGKVFVWVERDGDFFDKEYIADVAYYNNLAGGRIPKGTFFKPIPGKMEYEILDNVTHWMPIEPPKEDA